VKRIATCLELTPADGEEALRQIACGKPA